MFQPRHEMRRIGDVYHTEGGAVIPVKTALEWHDKFMNPIIVPSDMLPDSVFEGAGAGRVYHLPLPRYKVPLAPEEGRICEDCANFRYEAVQEWIKLHGDPFRDTPKALASRAPRAEDLGLCAAKDGNVLHSRFHGSVVERATVRDADGDLSEVPVRNEKGEVQYRWLCSMWKDARSVFSTADPRKDRSRSPLG